jgi:CBS domain-containing protein
MKARDIMTRNPQCILRGDTIATAAAFMQHLNCGALPVVRGGHSLALLGILTDRDIAVRCAAQGHNATACLVEDHMTPQPQALRADASVTDVADVMCRAQVRRIPITQGTDREVVGIVALADLVHRARRPDLALKVLERVSQAAPVLVTVWRLAGHPAPPVWSRGAAEAPAASVAHS